MIRAAFLAAFLVFGAYLLSAVKTFADNQAQARAAIIERIK